jgi:hypothetical protein
MNHIKPIVKVENGQVNVYLNSTKTAYKTVKMIDEAPEIRYYSYNTIIAFKPANSNIVYATTKKYSVTTSKQWSVYIAPEIRTQGHEIDYVKQEYLEKLLKHWEQN